MKSTYRLVSNNEPTEEELAELMHEVAVEAKQRAVEANKKLLNDIKQATAAVLRKQSEEIKQLKPKLLIIAVPNGSGKNTGHEQNP